MSNTARLCVIRDPIAKFESDYRFALSVESGFEIPFVPGYQLNSSIPLDITFIDYFSQLKANRLAINEWVELMYDYYCLSTGRYPNDGIGYFQSSFKDLMVDFDLKQKSPYVDIDVCRDQLSQMASWFGGVPERQYLQIIDSLGKDFISKPRVEEGLDILLH